MPNAIPVRELFLGRAPTASSLCLGAMLLFCSTSAWAQAAPEKAVLSETVRTDDGWTLPVTYFRSAGGQETPIVLLLHGGGGNRVVWNNTLAKRLHDAGYAVLTVDLRKHGDSQGPGGRPVRGGDRLLPADYQSMVRFDLEALKDYLLTKHQAQELNIRKLGIVAADDMSPIAANFAVLDWLKKPYPDAPTLASRTPRGQDVRAVVLLSPTENVPGVTLGRILTQLRDPVWNIATFVVVGAEDRTDGGTARKVYERLTTPDGKDRIFLESYDRVKDRGVELITNRSPAEARIVLFLDKYLKQLSEPWTDRKSRL